jgi:hypothetical protein
MVRGLGAGKPRELTVYIDDKICGCSSDQSFKEAFINHTRIRLKSEQIALPNGKIISILDRIGDHIMEEKDDRELEWALDGDQSEEGEEEESQREENPDLLERVENDIEEQEDQWDDLEEENSFGGFII